MGSIIQAVSVVTKTEDQRQEALSPKHCLRHKRPPKLLRNHRAIFQHSPTECYMSCDVIEDGYQARVLEGMQI